MDFIRPLPAYRGGMGMAQLSLKELQDMFKAYLQDLLGKDGVRQTYPQADATTGRGNSQPFQNPAEDICYYTVLPADNAINRQMDTRYEALGENAAKQIHSYTRVFLLQLTFYGPNAYDNACKVRMELISGGRDNLLAKRGLHIVPDIAEPNLTWELYQNRWLMRSDLAAQFNNRVTDEGRNTVGYIQAVPITVIGTAEERVIEIKEGEKS